MFEIAMMLLITFQPADPPDRTRLVSPGGSNARKDGRDETGADQLVFVVFSVIAARGAVAAARRLAWPDRGRGAIDMVADSKGAVLAKR
jgi:hypothetical protein